MEASPLSEDEYRTMLSIQYYMKYVVSVLTSVEIIERCRLFGLFLGIGGEIDEGMRKWSGSKLRRVGLGGSFGGSLVQPISCTSCNG